MPAILAYIGPALAALSIFKFTMWGVKFVCFCALGWFMFNYSILGVVSVMNYLEDLVPHNMFSVLVYFGIVDFVRISLALGIQTMMISYMVRFFFYGSTSL